MRDGTTVAGDWAVAAGGSDRLEDEGMEEEGPGEGGFVKGGPGQGVLEEGGPEEPPRLTGGPGAPLEEGLGNMDGLKLIMHR